MKGGWNFSKMALIGGWEIFTRNEGKPYIEEDGNFYIKCLYTVGRGVLTSLFYEDPPPPILPALLFSNFVQPPSLSFPVASNLPSSLLFLLPCFFGWIGDRATFDVLLYLKSDAQPFRNIHFISFNKSPLKVVSATFFLVCFVFVNERPCETRKMFFISFQALFSFLR